ncbi:hypothetical protein EON65_21370 [archaeon]|nr:MAG: hypothetical protein EON65_21370 [archaeon]
MLPQIKSPTNGMSTEVKRSQNIASRLITEDHLSILQDRGGHIGVSSIGKLDDVDIGGGKLIIQVVEII